MWGFTAPGDTGLYPLESTNSAIMFPFGCCRPQRKEQQQAVAHAAGGGTQDASPPLAPVQLVPPMLRSKSEVRILHVEAGERDLLRSQSMPALSLLEASRRRLLAAQQQEAAAEAQQQTAADAGAAMDFVQQYMQAIRDNNFSWASKPAVGELFLKGARMVAADKQTFHGRGAIVRRLNQGVETLARMAGSEKDSQLPTFEVSGPSRGPNGGPVIRMVFKRGVVKMTLTLSFTFQQGKIALLHNTRS